MGYRNQPIIEDFYGVKTFAASMGKGVIDLAAGISAFTAAREAQRKIAKKENEEFGKLVGSATIRQNEIFMGLKEKEFPGLDPDLMTQAISEIEAGMYGPDGSIAAEAALKSGKLNQKERKKYTDILNNWNLKVNNFTTDAALMLTDKEDYGKAIKDLDNYYFQGSNPMEKNVSYLAASTVYGHALPAGVTLVKRKKDGRNVSFTYSIKNNNPIFKDLVDFEKLKEDPKNPGFKLLTWNRDLATWNGNFVDKIGIETPDYNKEGLESGVLQKNNRGGSEIGPQFQHMLLGKTEENDDQIVTTVDTWVNVDGFKKAMSPFTDMHAADIWEELKLNEESALAYLSKHLEASGVNWMQQYVNGTLTKEDIVGEYKKLVDENMLSKFGLREGDETNGLKLEKRKITQDEIDQLKDAKVPGSDQLVADTDQYFYRDQKSSKNTSNVSEIASYRATNRSKLNDSSSTMNVMGQKSSIGATPKRMIKWDAANKSWVPYEFISVRTSGDGVSTSGTGQWRAVPMSGPELGGINAKDKKSFSTWLGY